MMKKTQLQTKPYKLFRIFDDMGVMKKFMSLFLVLIVGMVFAGCTFKAELDSRVVSGYSGHGSAYTPVLSQCGNDDAR
ncbi:MAG: hypothetical protein PHE67_09390 [Campylobacterales bacterium]|nr:hypothetical protein [Campylobacterales bacterium]